MMSNPLFNSKVLVPPGHRWCIAMIALTSLIAKVGCGHNRSNWRELAWAGLRQMEG